MEPPAPAPAPEPDLNETANADEGPVCKELDTAAQKPCCTDKLANATDDIWCLQAFPTVSAGGHM